MKQIKKLFITVIIVLTSIAINGCDPFDDIYLTLALETEFSTLGAGSNIFISSGLCLSDFDDYNDNNENLEEIRYVTSAYFPSAWRAWPSSAPAGVPRGRSRPGCDARLGCRYPRGR